MQFCWFHLRSVFFISYLLSVTFRFQQVITQESLCINYFLYLLQGVSFKMTPHGLCILVFMLLCNLLHLSIGEIFDLLLTKRICQMWWDANPCLCDIIINMTACVTDYLDCLLALHALMKQEAMLGRPTGKKNWKRVQPISNRWLGIRGGLWLTAPKKLKPWS